MPGTDTTLETTRLILRSWRADDLANFARLHADPDAMRDYGTTLALDDSRRKLDDYRDLYRRHGYIRWHVASKTGEFLGYTGLYPHAGAHPLGHHSDIGWRFLPSAWGHGYATEAAQAAIDHAFAHHGLAEVLAYTHATNLSSQAVIARLPFRRDPSRDFVIEDPHAGLWHGMVWAARPAS